VVTAITESSQDSHCARVCVLMPVDSFCEQLCQVLGSMGVFVRCFQDDEHLFSLCAPHEIDCLVLATGGMVAFDGLHVLESLQRQSVYVPAVVIANDGTVLQAVRAMRALASECFEAHTPLPIIARHVRSLAERSFRARSVQ